MTRHELEDGVHRPRKHAGLEDVLALDHRAPIDRDTFRRSGDGDGLDEGKSVSPEARTRNPALSV